VEELFQERRRKAQKIALMAQLYFGLQPHRAEVGIEPC